MMYLKMMEDETLDEGLRAWAEDMYFFELDMLTLKEQKQIGGFTYEEQN